MKKAILLIFSLLTACNLFATNPQVARRTATVEPVTALPEPTATATERPTLAPFPVVCTGTVLASEALNLRTLPDENSPLVDTAITLPAGAPVTLHVKSGDWWHVSYKVPNDLDVVSGYARADYIREDGCK